MQFHLDSHTPVPYQLCACSICRKVGGYSGSVNLGGLSKTLRITQGQDLIKKYRGMADRGKRTEREVESERSFCGNCSAMLWLYDESWPGLIHPFASAIDTELPEPAEMVCVRGDSKPKWVRWPEGKKSVHHAFGKESIEG